MDHRWFTNVEEGFNFEAEKKKLVNNLDFLKSLSVEEFTFYKKYKEIQNYKYLLERALIAKAKIWRPTDFNNEELTIKEIQDLRPKVIFVDERSIHINHWKMLRVFCHTLEFSQSPGRFLRFIVQDEVTEKYLGVISVAGDVPDMSARDKYIGWNNDNRDVDKLLANSAIGSCIMATQPFGYNFLGGKLMACLTTSKVVRDTWYNLYGNTLVGMSTTSLYGSFSMYKNLKWWHDCGSSAGKMPINPDEEMYNTWHQWLKENQTEEYNSKMLQKEGVAGPVTNAKVKTIGMIFNACGISKSKYNHGFERGVFYSCFYDNTKEFLCKKIDEKQLVMRDLFKNDVKEIINWWKPKAIDRYKKLKLENRLKPEVFYYNRMLGMTYEQSKEIYFKEVGR